MIALITITDVVISLTSVTTITAGYAATSITAYITNITVSLAAINITSTADSTTTAINTMFDNTMIDKGLSAPANLDYKMFLGLCD